MARPLQHDPGMTADPNPAEAERDTGGESPEPVRGQGNAGEDRPTPATDGRHALVWRVVRGVDYLFYLLYALLVTRFALALLGAREGAGFVRFIHTLTEPFYAPFRGIVSRPELDGGYVDLPLVLAVLAYVVLHVAIHGLIRLIVGPRYPEPRL